ncbi:hypothetical protein ANOM_002205 [Aspergillus nomiae NRRL 13137]|uniref:Uncharacterized protein n=1 Tax=Aspergillus nomiae NRRL (strain ATCC 15546 / NRRL 13137 / CBS 260.88 / M93) TaxID=1509407 RepID=A0A0L1JB29_ASPN3|nr:uncharacterized protein ANOM_002205 [Aspergillus nomiae NRRL 13137]KNG88944.1 hypothetical protein ANOM_002205 [Aspergillus nomiae NRRL 13137]
MSATIRSSIVDLDELIPRPEDIDREDKDVEQLTPWIFRQTDIAKGNCTRDWPQQDDSFRRLFDLLDSHYVHIDYLDARNAGIAGVLKTNETITLPRKNWRVSEREYHQTFLLAQSMMLSELMKDVYRNLDGIEDQGLEVNFTTSNFKTLYVIGRKQYATKPEGAVTVGPKDENLPIISYTGWYARQTWNEFLGETLSVMLGQLAQNMTVRTGKPGVQDQEVFVVGFHGPFVHIARAFFAADLVARVHPRGCSNDEVLELKFTRDYDLSLKKDWLEATRALARLFRYLLSGRAKVASVQGYLNGSANTAGESM